MTFVGQGEGDYITETTFKYVGTGRGNLRVITPTIILYGRICCLITTLIVFLALLAFLMRPGQTTTTSTTQMPLQPKPIGECTFWGDPHLKSFDGGRPSFYGDGEYWIVKSTKVKIQGRYMGTEYTKGLAATNKIIVGGPFLQGHTITVGTLDSGVLTVDGSSSVLAAFPSSYQLPGGLGSITYNSQGNLVDPATHIWEKKVVTMSLPMGVRVEVFRWKNYLDLRIVMPQIPGMDGSCGNFDGNPADDTTEAIFNRIGARVPHGENMFAHRGEIHWTDTEDKLLNLCQPNVRARAQAKCAGSVGAEARSCMLDYCFGANEHALKMTESLGL
eukprot:CAMPEP_0170377996 /NCGR_PEP_ID=MMETSP0117_2-20130122/12577_1 /TAXON_ID=400756 /ORGANISM="Durinskia baltica, Strain CSIRO CS-38" /LENGTH=330 /DNA_ID=CAMNT_0010633345 /DNA_START=84 /DNA_END=1076 /DNA_ORIENTATION=-